jgi:hypothetical protein
MTTVANALKPFGTTLRTTYIQNESTILFFTANSCSVLATVTALKNARSIIYHIDLGREMLSKTTDKDERFKIYQEVVKAITPLLLPVICFQAGAIFTSFKMKQKSDKKIAELTNALTVANNAIAAYQTFQKEAEKQLTDKQLEVVEKEMANKVIEEHPQTPENTSGAYVTGAYRYYDPRNNRYFWETITPSAWAMGVHNLSIALTQGEINEYDDTGACRVTYNDIWSIANKRLQTEGDRKYGWTDRGIYRGVDAEAIDVRFYPAVDPLDPNESVWYVDMRGDSFQDD